MQELSSKSPFAYLKENSISKPNTISLIDKYGELKNIEAYRLFCGFYNQLTKLGFKEKEICMLKGYPLKEIAPLICALMSLNVITYVSDCNESTEVSLELTKHAFKVDSFIYFEEGKGWLVKKDNKVTNLLLSQEDIEIDPSLIVDENKNSFIILTSGSTEKKKAVLLKEFGFINHVTRLISTVAVENERSYHCAPMHYIFGIVALIPLYLLGYSVFMSDTRNPEYALDIIEKYKCTKVENVPTFYFMLLDAQKEKPRDISSLRHGVISGGGYSKEQLIEIENTLGIKLCSIYGMTESSGLISASLSNDTFEDRVSGVGRVFPGVDVVLKDENGYISKNSGEICYKGYNLMSGYLTLDKLDLPIDEDGYFHTGDIGLFSEKGILQIIGRKKDIIIRGGENLSPAYIEQKICSIEGVSDACVVGVNNVRYGEIVGAYIVSKKYKSENEILPLLKAVLKKHEIPSLMVFKDEMLMLPNGKKNKNQIKELLINMSK